MLFPTVPTCHGETSPLTREPIVWLVRPYTDGDPYKDEFRVCWYCGSIHPADLLVAVHQYPDRVRIGGSDWKYGWPHKFYIEGIPNPIAGEPVVLWHTLGIDVDDNKTDEKHYGPAPATVHAKWYNEHLRDEGYDDEAWTALAAMLKQRTGIGFSHTDDGGILYGAPYRGYQR